MTSPAPKPRTPFGHRLRAELATAEVSIRELARRLDPEKPENARRTVTRWVTGGSKPTRENRRAAAVALGLEPAAFDDEEDSELVDELHYALRRIVQSEFARLTEQQEVSS